MTLATRTVTLPGGLQATLVHQPQADRAGGPGAGCRQRTMNRRASPVWRTCWNTCCFYGGERYRNDDRLMSWVQRRQGNENATPVPPQRVLFEVAAEDLADGVARLQEMLQAPLLLRDDIQREVAVIDAENRLIQQHELSRREAAVRHAAIAPTAFRRFQVGDAGSLGEDFLALQAALRDFHRSHYVARRMQLWLRRAAVAGGARRTGDPFRHRACPGRGTAASAAAHSGRAPSTAAGRLQPARAVALPADRLSDNVTLLREFLLDEAPGSLMAGLRQRGMAEDVALNWLLSGSALRLAGADFRQRPAGTGRPGR